MIKKHVNFILMIVFVIFVFLESMFFYFTDRGIISGYYANPTEQAFDTLQNRANLYQDCNIDYDDIYIQSILYKNDGTGRDIGLTDGQDYDIHIVFTDSFNPFLEVYGGCYD